MLHLKRSQMENAREDALRSKRERRRRAVGCGGASSSREQHPSRMATRFPDALFCVAAEHESGDAGSISDGVLGCVQQSAILQDVAAFAQLPPMLMHEDPRPSANKLYGGTQASVVPLAAYQPGRYACRGARRVLGGALFDLHESSHVAVVYVEGDDELVVHVHQAHLSELEAQLFDPATPVTNLEERWLGRSLAYAMNNLRGACGAFVRSGGASMVPEMLLSGEAHLVRGGCLAWLHLRAPLDDLEMERLSRAVTCAAWQTVREHDAGAHERAIALSVPATATAMKTVFDRCPLDANGGNGAEPPEEETMRGLAPLVEQAVLRSRHALLCELARVVLLVAPASVTPSKALEMLPAASDMARAAQVRALHKLTSRIATCGTISLVHLARCTGSPDGLLAVCTALYEARDVAVAAHDAMGAALAATFDGLRTMASRVCESQAVLLIRTDSENLLKQLRLVNTTLDRELRVDEAARLVACAWLVPIVYRASSTGCDAFLLDASRVCRERLRVDDAARRLRSPARATHSAPSAEGAEAAEAQRAQHDLIAKLADLSAKLPVQWPVPLVGVDAPGACTQDASLLQTIDILSALVRKRKADALSAQQ